MIGPLIQALGQLFRRIPAQKVMRTVADAAKKVPKDKVYKGIAIAACTAAATAASVKLVEKVLGDKKLTIEQKLDKLKALCDSGKITSSEYNDARKVALEGYARS
jgi:hypothetical protein